MTDSENAGTPEEQLKLRLMGMEVVLASVLKHLPAAREELLRMALALDAPSVPVPDHFGPTLASQIRAICEGRPGVRPND